MDKQINKVIKLDGLTYDCVLGWSPKQKVDSVRNLADVPAGFYLVEAVCFEKQETVPEGHLWDLIEREVWRLAKKGQIKELKP